LTEIDSITNSINDDDPNPELDFLPLSNIAQVSEAINHRWPTLLWKGIVQLLSVCHSFVDFGSNNDDMVNIDNSVITNPDLDQMDIDPSFFAVPDLEEKVNRNPQKMMNLLSDTNLLFVLESDEKDRQKTLF
ncbi:hypothetical protein C0995_008621, partial [Termitomyces sp. Mi166